jgi:hypothetical protein
MLMPRVYVRTGDGASIEPLSLPSIKRVMVPLSSAHENFTPTEPDMQPGTLAPRIDIGPMA